MGVLDRRSLLTLGAAAALWPASACAGPTYAVAVRRDPGCSCCTAWAEHLRASGRFEVSVSEDEDMDAYKQRLGVPMELRSCHTAEVDGYVIEGHVPAEDILQLLHERRRVRGLAVPGMPVGSPGMEMGDRRDPYDVIAFNANGTHNVFRSVAAHPRERRPR